ncbi:hypothetical protein [Inquilinus sp. Marseille-Q2685]|uniref:hypothetical protein n=1 Tax=Inquilinus sp. Marseille-Q2685 TaxID=2866581 RepID=UPI001CE48318|nr:hypothetical protein [Inquilinus sp. Marseille-Q2685]
MRMMKGFAAAALAAMALVACQEAPPKPQTGGLFPDVGNYQPVNLPAKAQLTPTEVRYDLLVKLQTEMMVTGLSCKEEFNDPIIFRTFSQWVVNNDDRILDTQDKLGKLLAKYNKGNGARLFDTYRTKMANDESQRMQRMTQAAYCLARKDQFAEVVKYNPQQLDDYLNKSYEMLHTRYNEVGAKTQTAAAPADKTAAPAVKPKKP